MAFVKLKKSILNSTVWMDRDVRDVWITALLMADLHEIREPTPTIRVGSLKVDPFVVPAGWYGFVPAASTGIIRMAGLERRAGMKALETLAASDPESRTPDHGGRRLVRVDGGFIVLTYDKHRQRDETAAERMRRYRDRRGVTSRDGRDVTPSQRVTDRNVTHQDQESDQDGDQETLIRARSAPPGRPRRRPEPDRLVAGTDAKIAELRAIADKPLTPEEVEGLRNLRNGAAGT